MPSTYSPSLRLELIGAGEQSGTWGTTTNTNLGTLLEQSIAGVQAITMTNANYTLSNFNGVSDEARRAVLVVSGTNAAVRDVIAPLATKAYTIKNNTTGGFAINIRAPSGSSVSIPNGVTSLVYCDGANFNLAVNQTSVAAGTGLSAATVGATTTISFGPLTSAQLATALTDETGTGANVFATSPTLVTPALGTPTALVGTNITGTATAFTASNVTTNANLTGGVTSVGNATTVVTNANLTGGVTSVGNATTVVTNANLTGAITSSGNATILGTASFTSAQLATALTDETGTGANVFATSPTLVTPALGTPSSGDLASCTFPTLNQNTTGSSASCTGNATTATTATTATNQSGGTVNATTITGSSDATINGVTVGRGASNAYANTAVGSNALQGNTTGNFNSAMGYLALYSNITGSYNSGFGAYALGYTTGSGNIGIGGWTASGVYSPSYNITTEDNYVQIGSTSVTKAVCKVAWTTSSDARDKTNFAVVPHGLDFVTKLKPTAYQFTEDRVANLAVGDVKYGFLAQDILELEGASPVIIDAGNPDHLYYTESNLIPILVNAIKELTARLEALEGKL